MVTLSSTASEVGTDLNSNDDQSLLGTKNAVTLLSIGVGVGYAFFGLFVIALVGVFLVVRLRQR
jgi:hypothetical protein